MVSMVNPMKAQDVDLIETKLLCRNRDHTGCCTFSNGAGVPGTTVKVLHLPAKTERTQPVAHSDCTRNPLWHTEPNRNPA